MERKELQIEYILEEKDLVFHDVRKPPFAGSSRLLLLVIRIRGFFIVFFLLILRHRYGFRSGCRFPR